MKKIILLFCFIPLFLNIACEGEIDPLQFAQGGELRYPGKVSSATYLAGKERLQIQLTLGPDPNVNKVIIYWNLSKEHLIVDIDRSSLKDNTVDVLIENLPENIYNFEIYTYDKFENKSIPTYLVGRTYGNRYLSILNNRPIATYEAVDNGGVKIIWGDSIIYSAGVRMEYTDLEQNKKVVEIPNIVNETILEQVDINKEIEISTLFAPEPNAIDIFESKKIMRLDPTKLILELKKPYALNHVGGFDSAYGGNPDKLWDGKWGKTFNQDGSGNPWGNEAGWGVFEPKTIPAWFTIDLSKSVKIARYRSGFYWPYMNGCPKKTELWAYTGEGVPTAEEGWNNWVKIGSADNSALTLEEMVSAYSLGDNIYPDYNSVPSAQYYRVKVLETWKPGASCFSISEVTFWRYTN